MTNGTPGNPHDCPYARDIRHRYPWAKHVKVGTKTISFYDYRCPHNPDGKLGGCSECPGKKIMLATPLAAAEAIRTYDRTGTAEFPPLTVRMEEARIVPATQDKRRKRIAQAVYQTQVAAGVRKPQKKTARAKGRAMARRRHS